MISRPASREVIDVVLERPVVRHPKSHRFSEFSRQRWAIHEFHMAVSFRHGPRNGMALTLAEAHMAIRTGNASLEDVWIMVTTARGRNLIQTVLTPRPDIRS
ncbi:hypothetical protein GCM10009532_30220 [Microbacterium aurantiacum]